MDNLVNEIFLGVMDLQEAKNHQIQLSKLGVELTFKTNGATCTTGCKVTVEVWGWERDEEVLRNYFSQDYLKNMKGHVPNFEHLNAVYDPSGLETVCQACGAKFSPKLEACPDCGLVYS